MGDIKRAEDPPTPHLLTSFMHDVTEQIAHAYERIQSRATEDPGTAGDQGEENWAKLLREWLPPIYQVVTKGRILSHTGEAGPQVDVLVLRPTYPKGLLNNKYYLADEVAAAFECKVTLKAEHIIEAVKHAVEIRKLFPPRFGSPYQELHSPTIYGLLAHSHVWKGAKSTPAENINNRLIKTDKELVEHPREMLDLICVADLATWVSSKMSWLGPEMTFVDWDPLISTYGPSGSAITSYMCFSKDSNNQRKPFTAIGSMLSHLLHKLAWEEPSVRRLAQYFFQTRLPGGGSGDLRLWGEDIYSIGIRNKVKSGELIHRMLDEVPSKQLVNDMITQWNEWSAVFI